MPAFGADRQVKRRGACIASRPTPPGLNVREAAAMLRTFSRVALCIPACAICAFGVTGLPLATQDDIIFRSGYEVSTCGNGLIEDSETCDDSNASGSDGCSATCREETGYDCSGSPSVCTPTCGDGAVAIGAEQCDDGNLSIGDGCSDTCSVEPGFMCSGSPSVCTHIP
jgi:cysteine-rich repeat protein